MSSRFPAGVLAFLVRSKPVYVQPPETVALEHLGKMQHSVMGWMLLATFRKTLQKRDKLRLKMAVHPYCQEEKSLPTPF